MRKAALLAVAAAVFYVSGQHAMAPLSGPVTGNANEALANQMATSGYGWTGGQLTCLDDLWTHENAAWDPTQWNLGGSGAYGIPQALPADKMASAGPDWRTNPATQIRWGLAYVHDRYGTPCGAWSHEKSVTPNWY